MDCIYKSIKVVQRYGRLVYSNKVLRFLHLMFKMASVLFGAQTGSGAEVVCYFDMGERRGGATGFLTQRPHFFDLFLRKTVSTTRSWLYLKTGSQKQEGGREFPLFY